MAFSVPSRRFDRAIGSVGNGIENLRRRGPAAAEKKEKDQGCRERGQCYGWAQGHADASSPQSGTGPANCEETALLAPRRCRRCEPCRQRLPPLLSNRNGRGRVAVRATSGNRRTAMKLLSFKTDAGPHVGAELGRRHHRPDPHPWPETQSGRARRRLAAWPSSRPASTSTPSAMTAIAQARGPRPARRVPRRQSEIPAAGAAPVEDPGARAQLSGAYRRVRT